MFCHLALNFVIDLWKKNLIQTGHLLLVISLKNLRSAAVLSCAQGHTVPV